MRHQLLKLKKSNSTKAERRFAELLKHYRVPFKAKVRIQGREIDFLIGKYAIDIDCHEQARGKNEMLAEAGYVPLHFSNKEISAMRTLEHKYHAY